MDTLPSRLSSIIVNVKKILAILLCKLARFAGKLIGRGSSLPGRIALKIDKDILKKIKLPDKIIAVSGSNGKTSTVEMIAKVLTDDGYSVAYNKEGSNLLDGVATLVLEHTDLLGRFKKDVLLMESDERYARYTFRQIVPTYYVITNLYRDQLTRNGHPEYVAEAIEDSIMKGSILILNEDIPLIASFEKKFGNRCYTFGIKENSYASKENSFSYDDGKYCPLCKGEMEYDYHIFGHVGSYHCKKCGFERRKPDFEIDEIDLKKGSLTINGECSIDIALKSVFNAYNVLATYSLCKIMGLEDEKIAQSLSNYMIRNGRVKTFVANGHEGTLLISKHENSVSYNQNIRYLVDTGKDVTVFIMVDAISRKYFTSETSWLWDISFNELGANNVKKIIVTGQYSSDIMERLSYCNLDMDKIHADRDIDNAVNYLKDNAIGYTYVITCFSDEDKFMRRVEAL